MMNILFEDEFITKRIFSRLLKEVKSDQLEKTINEISYFDELRNHVLSRPDFTKNQNRELDFIKKLNNAKRKNIQA